MRLTLAMGRWSINQHRLFEARLLHRENGEGGSRRRMVRPYDSRIVWPAGATIRSTATTNSMGNRLRFVTEI